MDIIGAMDAQNRITVRAGVDVRWGDLSIFTWELKLEFKIPWKEFWLLLFKYCLKNGSNFPMNMSVKHVS